MPPKLGVNPKGFWEPEAVSISTRGCCATSAATGTTSISRCPHEGELVDDFVADAHALLATEYGDAATILIKDPRICVLAPLWHRALASAGLPAGVRRADPQSARSRALAARARRHVGAPKVSRCGSRTWSASTRSPRRGDDVHLRPLHRSARRLARRRRAHRSARSTCALDAGDRAATRSTASSSATCATRRPATTRSTPRCPMDARSSTKSARSIGARSTRCDRDARDRGDRSAADAINAAIAGAVGAAPSLATASFVLCIENNAIRDQALLLCESIRRFAGRHRDAPILAYAPRPGSASTRDTRARLREMRVEYFDEPLNAHCRDYGSANRVFAGAHAERHARHRFHRRARQRHRLARRARAAARRRRRRCAPSTTRAARRAGRATASRRTGSGSPPSRGIIARPAAVAARRRSATSASARRTTAASSSCAATSGILARCADLFAASLAPALRPYRGTGIDIFASTGSVGRAGSEFWGSNQAALALAIWASDDRVRPLSRPLQRAAASVAERRRHRSALARRAAGARPLSRHVRRATPRGGAGPARTPGRRGRPSAMAGCAHSAGNVRRARRRYCGALPSIIGRLSVHGHLRPHAMHLRAHPEDRRRLDRGLLRQQRSRRSAATACTKAGGTCSRARSARWCRASNGTGYFKFAFVRNPWDRLVSWYHMCMQATDAQPFARYVQQHAPTFDDFVTAHDDGNRRAHDAQPARLRRPTSSGDVDRRFHRPLRAAAGGPRHGRRAARACRRRCRISTARRTRDYREYYTDETRDIVAARFARDIQHSATILSAVRARGKRGRRASAGEHAAAPRARRRSGRPPPAGSMLRAVDDDLRHAPAARTASRCR